MKTRTIVSLGVVIAGAIVAFAVVGNLIARPAPLTAEQTAERTAKIPQLLALRGGEILVGPKGAIETVGRRAGGECLSLSNPLLYHTQTRFCPKREPDSRYFDYRIVVSGTIEHSNLAANILANPLQ